MSEKTIPVPESLVDGLLSFMNWRFDCDRLIKHQWHFIRELQRAKDSVLTIGGIRLQPKMAEEDGSGCDTHPFDKSLHFADLTVNKLRLLGSTICKANFTSEQAQAFLTLYSTELKDRMEKALRDFVTEKLKP